MTGEYIIEGIMCNKCINHITEVVAGIHGVGEFNVQRTQPQLTLEYLDPDDAAGVEVEVLAAVEGIGYPIQRVK